MQEFMRALDILLTVVFVAVICYDIDVTESLSLKSRLFRNANITRKINSRNDRNVTTTTPPPISRVPQKVAVSLRPGLVLIGSVGNKSFYTNPDKLGVAWTEALDFCHELGLQPASIESLAEHKITRNFLSKLPHRFFWLAGTDYFQEGNWKWLKSGETFRFKKWTQGFPTKNRKNNCLYLSYGNDGWIDASCSSNKLIIRPLCQSEKL